MGKNAPTMQELREAGDIKEKAPKRVPKGMHHFVFTEDEAKVSGIYEWMGTRSLVEIKRYIFWLALQLRLNKKKIVDVKEK